MALTPRQVAGRQGPVLGGKGKGRGGGEFAGTVRETDWQRKRKNWGEQGRRTTQWGDKWPRIPDALYFSGAQQGYANSQFPYIKPVGRASQGYEAPFQQFTDQRQPPEPRGNYQSLIDARPFDAARVRTVSDVASQWGRPGAVASQALGYGSAGANSAAALGRSLNDLSRTALQRGTDTYGTQYQTEAQQARAEDIQSQRQNTMDRFKMDTMKAIHDADTFSRWMSEQSDIKAYYQRELANSNSIVTQAVTRGLMGFLGGLI